MNSLPPVQLLGQCLASLKCCLFVPRILVVNELWLPVHIEMAEDLGAFGKHAQLKVELGLAEGFVADFEGVII